MRSCREALLVSSAYCASICAKFGDFCDGMSNRNPKWTPAHSKCIVVGRYVLDWGAPFARNFSCIRVAGLQGIF